MALTSSPSEESLKLKRALLPYLLLCACFVVLSGYRFCDDGRYFFGDSSIHVPFIMLKWNPHLFQGDLVRDAQKGFVTLFFALYGKLTHNMKQLEIAYFVSFCVFNFLLMFSLSRLFFLLCRDETASFLSVACIYFGFVPVLGGNFPYNEMVHSTAAFPFVIAALYFFFKKQYVLCGILLGIATDFHGIYALFVFAAVWIYFILDFSASKQKLRELILFTACYVVFSLPIFIMKSGQVGSPVSLQQWMSILSVRAPHHFFPHLWDREIFLRFFLFCFLFVISLSACTEGKAMLTKWKKELTAIFLCVCFFVFVVGTFFLYVYPLRIAIELTGCRATLLLIFLGYPFIMLYLLSNIKQQDAFRKISATLMLCALLSNYYTNLLFIGFAGMFVSRLLENSPARAKAIFLMPAIALFFLLSARHLFVYVWKGNIFTTLTFAFSMENAETFKIVKLWLFSAACAVFLVLKRQSREKDMNLFLFVLGTLLIVSILKAGTMGTSSFYLGASREYKDVQLYAKHRTPKNALFLVPPYLTSFRTYSECGIFLDYKSGTYSSYNPAYARLWWQRLQALGIHNGNTAEMTETYNHLSEKHIRSLSKEFHITHFVTESKKVYPFLAAYKNKTFTLYKL